MRLPDNLTNKKFFLIIYKLLHDALFVTVVFLAAALLAEGLLPGIVSEHIGMSKPIFLTALLILLISFFSCSPKAEIKEKITYNKKLFWLSSFFGIMLILNSMLKINIFLNVFITAAAVAIAYLLYQLTDEENLI